jgi:5-formyltetrahydrofolate cyclo-ligase
MPQEPSGIERQKRSLRRQAEANRRALPDKDEASRIIWDKLAALPEYARAGTMMAYVHFGSEVRTQRFLAAAPEGDKRIVVPYCLDDDLGLFLLKSMEELAPGTWGILEPKAALRATPDRHVDAGQLDLVVVPGVAFDRRGARLGHGKGYYDRLLARVRPDTALVALAFECQVFAEIPTEPHDVRMHAVITEAAVYRVTSPE